MIGMVKNTKAYHVVIFFYLSSSPANIGNSVGDIPIRMLVISEFKFRELVISLFTVQYKASL